MSFFYNYSIMFAVLQGYVVCLLIQNILSSFVHPFQVAKEHVHKLNMCPEVLYNVCQKCVFKNGMF